MDWLLVDFFLQLVMNRGLLLCLSYLFVDVSLTFHRLWRLVLKRGGDVFFFNVVLIMGLDCLTS